LRCCNRLNGFIEFCSETDSDADSKANGNARTNSHAGTNRNAATFRDSNANADPGCRNKSMPATCGLWSCILVLKHEFA
jgi:hypothetical protein